VELGQLGKLEPLRVQIGRNVFKPKLNPLFGTERRAAARLFVFGRLKIPRFARMTTKQESVIWNPFDNDNSKLCERSRAN
jgi:hypothetical protein